jgi:hypothetical protein
MEFTNISQESEIQKKEFQNDYNFNNSNKFEEVIKKIYSDTLIQDILKPEQIIDGNCKSLTIAHGEDFQPLGLFCDKHFKKITFQHYFLNMKNHLSIVYIKKIVQVELTSANRKLAYHITIYIFFKTIKILIHFILSFTWIRIQNFFLLNCTLRASDVSKNVNLN